MLPSLVTCPTMITAQSLVLAKRTSAAAHSRSCAGEPAAASDEDSRIVWTESMIRSCGRRWAADVRMSSRDCWLSKASFGAFSCRRLARSEIWATDSSPLAYRVCCPFERAAATCSSRVDLPIPSSPPSSVTEPTVSPPPNTRSSSLSPNERRSGESACSGKSSSELTAAEVPGSCRTPRTAVTASSESHSLQWVHWPCHLTASPPQARQTYSVWVRAKAPMLHVSRGLRGLDCVRTHRKCDQGRALRQPRC